MEGYSPTNVDTMDFEAEYPLELPLCGSALSILACEMVKNTAFLYGSTILIFEQSWCSFPGKARKEIGRPW